MSSLPPPPGFPPAPASAPAPAVATALAAGRAAWPPWLSLAAIVTGFGITIAVGFIVVIGSSAFGVSPDENLPPGLTIALTLVQNVALVGAAFGFAWMTGRPAAADFGLRAPRFWRSVGLLVAVWVGFIVLGYLWGEALNLHDTQSLPEELGADGPLGNVLAVVVLITVIAPLGEELFFRGFFFGALRNWRGPWIAALLTGLVFGVIHAGSSPVGYLVPLAILGIGLCLLYEWTGSLYPSIALHALNNSIALGANLHWSWQIPAMMVGSTAGALGCAWLLARAIGDGRRAPVGTAPAPGPS
jgi:membrane protease YdiL (CAAX protease family)